MLPGVTEAYCELLGTTSGIQWWYVGSYKRDDTLQILFVFQANLMQAQWSNGAWGGVVKALRY